MKNKYQCQNNETQIVLDYFKGRKGAVLDIGANNGYDLSNSYDLIKQGWRSICVEPSSVFKDLKNLHKNNHIVDVHNVALGTTKGKLKFFESGAHVKGGTDKALVSTAVPKEMDRWKDVEFTEKEVDVIPVEEFLMKYEGMCLNYVSLDVEGMEWDILQQINLSDWGVEMLCIEWNGNTELRNLFTEYCNKFGLKEIHKNPENLIYAL